MPDEVLRIVNCPTQKVVGLAARIPTAGALHGCMEHWQETFAPYLKQMSDLATVCLGIIPSYEPARETFKYIASVPLIPGLRFSDELDEFEIPGGLYLESLLIEQAHRFQLLEMILKKWLPGRKDYRLNTLAPIYEMYPTDYQQTGLMTIYIPVNIKKD